MESELFVDLSVAGRLTALLTWLKSRAAQASSQPHFLRGDLRLGLCAREHGFLSVATESVPAGGFQGAVIPDALRLTSSAETD